MANSWNSSLNSKLTSSPELNINEEYLNICININIHVYILISKKKTSSYPCKSFHFYFPQSACCLLLILQLSSVFIPKNARRTSKGWQNVVFIECYQLGNIKTHPGRQGSYSCLRLFLEPLFFATFHGDDMLHFYFISINH